MTLDTRLSYGTSAAMVDAFTTLDPSPSTQQVPTFNRYRRQMMCASICWVICAFAPTHTVAQTARTTANQGAAYGWQDPDGFVDGTNTFSLNTTDDKTMAASGRLYNTVGDPAPDISLPAYNGNYTLSFRLTASTPTLPPGNNSTITAFLTIEYSINGGGSWFSVGGTSQVTVTGTGPGFFTNVQTFTPTVTVSGGGPVWIRLVLRGTASGTLPGGAVKVQIYASSGAYYPVTWSNFPGTPVVDALPYNFDNQNYGSCAQACFAAVHAQSTVPYYSLDAARSVSLAYNGDRVSPKPFVAVNVKPDVAYGSTPIQYKLQVKVNGGVVTFLNGELTLNFAYVGTPPARIGGQFDASSYATGVYPLEILVTAVYPSTSLTASVTTKLAVVNETTNPVARGWTIVGIQRLYSQGDGSALVTEGGGSAVYFQKVGSAFVAPAGEFSTLVTGTPLGGPGWTRRFPDSTKVVFDTTGKMSEVRDRFINITTVTYDVSDRIWKITDPNSKIITLAYGANGLSTITDAGSPARVTTVTVDASKRLTLIKDPDNVGTAFGYDASLRLSTITDRRGFTTTLGYDAQSGKLASITPPAVEVVNEDGSLTTASPITTFESWQKKGVPYGPTGTPVTPPRADTIYARITDPGGHIYRYTVNRWGAPQQSTDGLGRTTTVTYNPNGLPIRVLYPTGVQDTIGYSATGLPTYVRPAGRDSAIYARYAAWAQPDSVWGFQVPPVRNFIGANGRVDSTRTWGPGGAAITRYVYETRGRVERITDALNHLAERTWYAGTNGNRSKDSLPGGRVRTYGYDAYGRQTSDSAPGVNQRFMTFDVLNRVLKDSIFGMPPTVNAYDSLFLKTVTDPKGQVYRFAYNALGWTTARTDPANHADSVRYNRDGLVRIWKNRRFEVIGTHFDAAHRPVAKGGTNTDSVTWTYPSDTVVTATNPWATDTQFFSRAGRLDSIRTKLSNQAFTQRFRYTIGGQLDSVTAVGGGITFLARKYVWDAQTGQLNSIRLGGGGSTALARNADLQVTAATLPGGDQVAHAYTSVHDDAETSTGAQYAQTINRYVSFDIARRIDRQILGDGTSGWDYGYDALGRLMAVEQITDQGGSNPCTPPNIIDENGNECTYAGSWVVVPGGSVYFSYDSVGNRRDQSGTYGPGNRIRQFAGCTYVTDSLGDGNVLSRTCGAETVRFHWTAESRLKALKVVGGDSIDFHYDAAGRLVRKDVNTVVQAYFLWQGDNLLAELNAGATAKIAEYSYYPGLDNLHAVITGTTPYFAHADGIGNVIALTDSATKTIQRSYAFDVWGTLNGGTDVKPFNNVDRPRFKGALWLGPQVDLYYMRARWYEPRSGRFLSEDPLGLEAGINQYVFANDDPINRRDPTGLDPNCPAGYTFIIEIDLETESVITYCENDAGHRTFPNPVELEPVTVTACQYCGPYDFQFGRPPATAVTAGGAMNDFRLLLCMWGLCNYLVNEAPNGGVQPVRNAPGVRVPGVSPDLPEAPPGQPPKRVPVPGGEPPLKPGPSPRVSQIRQPPGRWIIFTRPFIWVNSWSLLVGCRARGFTCYGT